MTISFASTTTKTLVGTFPVTTSSVVLTAGVSYVLWSDVEWSAGTAPTPTIAASTGESTTGGEIVLYTDGTRTASQVWGASSEKRINAWLWTPTSTGARTVTWSATGTVVSYRLGIVEVSGADPTTSLIQVQTAVITSGTTVTVTMPVAMVGTSSTLYIGAHRQTGAAAPSAPLVSPSLQTVSNANGLGKVAYAPSPDATPDVVFSASGRGAAIGLEVAIPSVVADVIIPVYLDVVLELDDYPEVDPEEPPDEEEETPPDVVEVPAGSQQSPGARPNPMREMDLPRILADALAQQAALQGQMLAARGSLPHVEADPEFPQNGDAWVRSDTGELVWKAGGVVYRVSTGGT